MQHHARPDVSNVLFALTQVFILNRIQQLAEIGNLGVQGLLDVDQISTDSLFDAVREAFVGQQAQMSGEDGRLRFSKLAQQALFDTFQFAIRAFDGLLESLVFVLDRCLLNFIARN